MPYKDPEVRKARQRQKYRDKPHLWKNPDGSWKKSQTDRKANSRRHYYKNRDAIAAKRKARVADNQLLRMRCCPVCGDYDEMVWDHDHKTDEFRGWICNPCNLALGHAGDRPDVLRKLAEYLECPKNFEITIIQT